MDHQTIQKRKIKRTALKLFLNNGYSKTTTREIADACEINKGTLHYYYNQKENIAFELYEDFVRGIISYLGSRYSATPSGLSMVALMNMLFYKVLGSDEKYVDCLSDILSTQRLAYMKIRKSVESCLDFVDHTDEDTLTVAMTVTIGAESQLLYGIQLGTLHMSYAELPAFVERIFLKSLDIGEEESEDIIRCATEECDSINTRDVLDYLIRINDWDG